MGATDVIRTIAVHTLDMGLEWPDAAKIAIASRVVSPTDVYIAMNQIDQEWAIQIYRSTVEEYNRPPEDINVDDITNIGDDVTDNLKTEPGAQIGMTIRDLTDKLLHMIAADPDTGSLSVEDHDGRPLLLVTTVQTVPYSSEDSYVVQLRFGDIR